MHSRSFFETAVWAPLTALCVLIAGCAGAQKSDAARATHPAGARTKTDVHVVSVDALEWRPLNPARGDKSPQAAVLWGDRNASAGPTAFLVRFVDGFASPPHIHNISYRGVVVSGNVHNAHPDAEPVWMPATSYWTQPHGDVHITAAQGESVALVEIDTGPYQVQPPANAYPNEEPVRNVLARNIPWRTRKNDATGIERAFLWGDPQVSDGALLRLPAGKTANVLMSGTVRTVVITGNVSRNDREAPLAPGSHLVSQGDQHEVWRCDSTAPCVLYVRCHRGDLRTKDIAH